MDYWWRSWALTRIYGLGVDALLSIDLVLSNFTIITESETQNHDLFRAIRGSGGSAYGIAISLLFVFTMILECLHGFQDCMNSNKVHQTCFQIG
jgi:hypothetical protein